MPFVQHPTWGEQLVLGKNPKTGKAFVLEMADRYPGFYILGNQGTGKSSFIETQIYQDALQGNGVIVIDPHGDLVDHTVAALPLNRIRDTYVLDLTDEEFPFGCNLFSTAEKLTSQLGRSKAISRILHMFDIIWPESSGQQWFPRLLRAGTITFLDNPRTTLVDMQRLITREDYRAQLLKNVTDPTVLDFWDDFNHAKEAEQDRRSAPLVGRLEGLFMGQGLVRNIVGQRVNSISFRQAIEEKQIILIKLPIREAEAEAKLVGTILLAQIQAAIFSFADTPPEKRPGVSVYVDEFQNFIGDDVEVLFTQGRKYGLRLTVAHQTRNQITSKLQEATATAFTKVCFRLTAGDANEMAQYYPANSPNREKVEAHACAKMHDHLTDYGEDCRFFVEEFLRPVKRHGHGDFIVITDVGSSWKVFATALATDGNAHPKVKVENPVLYLDPLFYEVMQSGNPHLPIPREALVGLSDVHRPSFYQLALHLKPGDALLSPRPDYPPHLVVQGEWTRKPENAREVMWYCIFSIRKVMAYLAAHPMQEPTAEKHLPNAVVAGMLSQLQNRWAFVRSGQEVGTIQSLDTPPSITGEALAGRLKFIQWQTRQRYCHPRQEVERAERQPVASAGTVVPPRWEDV
jgi:hypothetical protein